MKFNNTLRAIVLLILVVSLLPAGAAAAFDSPWTPPTDMFQLPWEQGLAWVAIDGIDNGYHRPISSSHNRTLGGAIDFAPHNKMIKGENTSSFWVAAAASGMVVGVSKCHVIIDHGNGWITQYQFLGNVQVHLGDGVQRNQRLGIIADGVRYKFCAGSIDPDIPHLHFMLRPTMIDATFAGWHVNYNPYYNITSFTKNGTTLGLYHPLLNTFDDLVTPTFTPSPSPSPTPSPIVTTPVSTEPNVSTTVEPPNINVGETALVTVSLNNVPPEGYTSAEFVCSYNPSILAVSNILITNLFGPDPAIAINGPANGNFIVAIAGSHGNRATTSGPAFTFNVTGLQAGQTLVECKVRVSMGNNILVELPSTGTVVNVYGVAPTSTPTSTPIPTDTPPPTAPPTLPVDNWSTYTNSKYGFEFKYPSDGQLLAGNTDTYARINLPFAQGTNLTEKYLEAIVTENADPCQSLLATQSMLQTSEQVVINGITFLKQTGEDGTAGHTNKWIAYSTARNNVCVSLDFVLRSANPGVFETPPPLYDEVFESGVFGQIVSTYTWLDQTPPSAPILNGQVIAPRIVTVNLYDADNILVASVATNVDGTFTLTAPAGTYTTVASLSGFLNAQASVVLTDRTTTTLSTTSLLAGDIDGNNVIDQFDALTIGMNYNNPLPAAADLNNDGIINVLDLERLAANYRKTGPAIWQ